MQTRTITLVNLTTTNRYYFVGTVFRLLFSVGLISSVFCGVFFGTIDRAEAQGDSHLNRLHFSGDLRYRTAQQREGWNDSRLYQQLRARLGVKVDIQEDLKAYIRLATATSAISNNQTLGDSKEPGMARRFFGLDWVYGEWAYVEEAKLMMGRFGNPFFAPGKTQMIFDSDLAFEGIASSWHHRLSDGQVFLNIAALIISENYAAPRDVADTGLLGLDLGYTVKSEDFGEWTIHLARFHFLNIAGQPITSLEAGAKLDSASSPFQRARGNSAYADDPSLPTANRTYLYQYEFTQTEAGIEWKLKTDAVEYTTYADGLVNDHAGDLGHAIEFGFIAKYGRAQLLVAANEKKSDSVVGAFTDSDFNGGGTDNRGMKVGISYQLSDNSSAAITDFHGTRGLDTTPRPYNSQHLDFSLQF